MRLFDQHWRVIQPLLPPPSFAVRGRPPIDERAVLDGIFYKLITAQAWYFLPPEYPSWQTCYRRYAQWKNNGLLDQIQRALHIDLRDRGGIDYHACIKDRTFDLQVTDRAIHLTVPQSLNKTWQLLSILILTALLRRTLKIGLRRSGPLPITLHFSPVIDH